MAVRDRLCNRQEKLILITTASGTTCSLLDLALPAKAPVIVTPLGNEDQDEVLSFLSQRRLHIVMMAGMIRDNGLLSVHNRGSFYGCRAKTGKLEGVALIGHATLMETCTDRALEALAYQAQTFNRSHMIMGEQQRILEFWSFYAKLGQPMRLACRELLLELKPPVVVRETARELRLARPSDLDLLMPVQAQMAFEESGMNPLAIDAEGFRRRCLRRIDQERTWVSIEQGRLQFKAEIISDLPEVSYLEGIYVAPSERGKGYGLQCLSELTRLLFRRTSSICILVNERNTAAQAFYRKGGFKFCGLYDTIFLTPETPPM